MRNAAPAFDEELQGHGPARRGKKSASVARFDSGRPICLVRSAGTVGSGVALALYQANLPVVLLHDGRSTTLRQRMCYEQAIHKGHYRLRGVTARCVAMEEAGLHAWRRAPFIPLVVGSLQAAIACLRPGIVIDACVKGPRGPAILKGRAEVVIGIGPRFDAGKDVDFVVESAWGPSLGAVIGKGRARNDCCGPEVIEGLSWGRFARSQRAGTFRTAHRIGKSVGRGDIVGMVEDWPVRAPSSGKIRGLLPDGASVALGDKVLEIDPRASNAQCSGVCERSRQIAQGVLCAIAGAGPSAGPFGPGSASGY